MNEREEIIRLAEQVRLETGFTWCNDTDCLARFAHLISAQYEQDAKRYRWLREHSATVFRVVEERRGYRTTTPDAKREVWLEPIGWSVSSFPTSDEYYETMDEAVDAAMEQTK